MTVAVAHHSTQRAFAWIIAAFLACACALWATPAHAHSDLKASTPADGASVTELSEITLTFAEAVTPEFSAYTLTDTAKAAVKLGTPRYDTTKTTVTIPLAQMVGGGDYTIGYSILSVDGHKIAGTVKFTSTAPAMVHEGHGHGDRTGPPPSGMPMDHDHDEFGPDRDGDNDSSNAIWFALGGALLGAVIVAVIAWLIRRRSNRVAGVGTDASTAGDKNESKPAPSSEATLVQDKPTQDKPKRAPKKSDD